MFALCVQQTPNRLGYAIIDFSLKVDLQNKGKTAGEKETQRKMWKKVWINNREEKCISKLA